MSHKVNAKYDTKLNRIDERLNALHDDNEDKEVALMESFENCLSDTFLQYSTATTTEDYNYLEFLSQIVADYDLAQKELETQRAALFLVATHIAHRGKMLHPDNARIALARYGNDGKKIIAMLDNSHLARELHKNYRITLMDKELADSVTNKIKDLSRYADPEYNPRAYRKLQQCKNFLNKFHKATLNIEKTK